MLSGIASRMVDFSFRNGTYPIVSMALSVAECLRRIFRVSISANKEITLLQNELVPLVRDMRAEGRICFTTDRCEAVAGGDYWKLARWARGMYFCELFNQCPKISISIAHSVCTDYQKVIRRYQGDIDVDPGKARDWLWSSLAKWSRPIVQAGLMSREEIAGLAEEFRSAMARKGADFFGWVHGNVVGNHVFIGDGQEIYLLGMRIVPRPGRGYYDFLRTLDWFFLYSSGNDAAFRRTASWIGEYLGDFDKDEVRLVFALRCIGILGWDILHRGVGTTADMKAKTRNLLRFIRRKY